MVQVEIYCRLSKVIIRHLERSLQLKVVKKAAKNFSSQSNRNLNATLLGWIEVHMQNFRPVQCNTDEKMDSQIFAIQDFGYCSLKIEVKYYFLSPIAICAFLFS